ncbi:MAG: EutP/PduV family microcompartment system protein [Propionicimonas sp.]|nr:EutP/PduV family microcompartment system protein [Propionicimonas sp.]
MKRILLVGSVGCGKTTLLQRLHGDELSYAKTETIYTDGQVVDTPGEYLELPWFKHALRLASFEVELVVLLASATVTEAKFPPGFTTFFMPPSIGVVTKTDIAGPSQIGAAGDHLRLAGATEVLTVSALTGDGIDDLRARLA